MRVFLFVVGMIAILWGNPSHAESDTLNHTWEIYLSRGVTSTGLDRLTFVDILTGRTITTEVSGERYTPLGAGVLYYDYVNRRMMWVDTEGIPRPHPFMNMDSTATRIDWVVSRDGRMIAWTLTYGDTTALTTVTQVATAEGANRREVLRDGARAGIRALPVAFNPDHTLLYMDAQPDGLGRFVAYAQYAGLFSVHLASGELKSLPNEPSCFCGAGFRAGQFLRLALSNDLSGFDVRVYDLETKQESLIPSAKIGNYTLAGDILITPDGTKAVYALSQVANFGTPNQSVQTVFMLVDLLALTQSPLTPPITTYVQPRLWAEENSAILFTSPQLDGTWKIRLADGELKKVASATFLGTLSQSPSGITNR